MNYDEMNESMKANVKNIGNKMKEAMNTAGNNIKQISNNELLKSKLLKAYTDATNEYDNSNSNITVKYVPVYTLNKFSKPELFKIELIINDLGNDRKVKMTFNNDDVVKAMLQYYMLNMKGK